MDERLTDEQIQAEQERLNAIRDGTAGSVELNKELEFMKMAMGGVTKVAKDYTKHMAQGVHGAKTFNGAIDTAATGLTTAIGMVAAAVAVLTGGLILLGTAVVGLTVGAVKLGATWAKASNEQADALFKTYQDLNKIGAAGSTGMSGIFRDMQNFGYNVQQLDQMVSLIAENSQTLAQFGNIASMGTKRFAQLSNEVRDSDVGRKLFAAGNTVDDLNQAEVTYLKTLTLLGKQRNKTDRELIAGASALADNFDLLRRVTGETLADQARKQVELYRGDVYGQVMEDLEGAGELGKENAEIINNVMQVLPDTIRQMMSRSIGGRVAPEDAKMFAAMPRFTQMMQQLGRGEQLGLSQDQIYDMFREEIKTRNQAVKSSFRLGVGKNIFGLSREEMTKVLGPGTYQERMAQAKKDQQLNDQTTESIVDLNLTQMDATRALDTLVNVGINPTITALQGLAEVATSIYEAPGSLAPSMFGPAGGSKLGPVGGGGDGYSGTRAGKFGNFVKSLIPGPSEYKPASGGKGEWKNDKSFMDAVDAFAKKKKINVNDILAVMGVETAGTMDPSIKNPKSSASGLIQFMDSTAKELGTTTAELRKMTRVDQMKYVEKYFDMVGLRNGADIGEIYQKVFMPNRSSDMLAKRGTAEYAKNAGLDVNKDGIITRSDLSEIARQRGVQMGLGMDLKPGATPAGASTVPATPKPEEKKPAPAGPNQVYKPALPTTKPEASIVPEKPALNTPSVEVQQANNEELFKMMERQTSTFESMLALQRKTADNTGKMAKQGQ